MTFHIRPAWPDVLLYEEEAPEAPDAPGGTRALRFDALSLAEPPQAVVPGPLRWPHQTPAWAHARRALIVERLRAARCVLYEEDAETTAVQSPDGSFRVEHHCIDDGRVGPWEATDLLRLPGGERVARMSNHRWRAASQPLVFPRPGVVVLSVGDHAGQRRPLEIDVAAGRFRLLDTDAEPQPLAQLQAALAWVDAPVVRAPVPRMVSLRARLGDAAFRLGGLALIGAGLWMAIAGGSLKDRLIGAACAVFFTACVIAPPLMERRRRGVEGERER